MNLHYFSRNRGGLAWIKYPTNDMVLTFSYSTLGYQLIRLVGSKKMAQITLKLLEKRVPTSN